MSESTTSAPRDARENPELIAMGAMPQVAQRPQRSRWRSLIDQTGTILLSLALAVVIWLIAVSQANPLITEQFPERLPITVRGLDGELQSVQDLSRETVRIDLRAPRAAWDDLDPTDFSVSLDLSAYGEGTHEAPIVVQSTDPRVTIQQVNPPSIIVQLDPVASKVFTVTAAVMDSAAFGYDYGAPIVEPPTVTVRGPASQVDLVNQVVAPVYLLNAKSQVERTVAVDIINRQNQEVSGVEVSSSFVHIVVPVEQWPGRKEVAVRIDLVGQPANGYRLSSVRAEPSNVVLQGRAEILATVPGYIETEPLSIEGATSDIRTRLGLVVPPGVTVFDSNTVEALVMITAVEGGTTARMRPIIQGLTPGLDATFSPETVDVILSGPLPALEGLNPDDIFAILDLSGLLPGTHIIRPRIALPVGITEGGVLPETVEVVITAPPAPTEEDAPVTEPSPESTPADDLAPADDFVPFEDATGNGDAGNADTGNSDTGNSDTVDANAADAPTDEPGGSIPNGNDPATADTPSAPTPSATRTAVATLPPPLTPETPGQSATATRTPAPTSEP